MPSHVLCLGSWVLGPRSLVPVHPAIIAKCDKKLLPVVTGIAKCDSYYKVRQKIITMCDRELLQSVTAITKCNKTLLQSVLFLKNLYLTYFKSLYNYRANLVNGLTFLFWFSQNRPTSFFPERRDKNRPALFFIPFCLMVASRFLSRPASHINSPLVFYLLSQRSFKSYYVNSFAVFLDQNLPKCQCGFRTGLSVQDCLVAILEKWKDAVDN